MKIPSSELCAGVNRMLVSAISSCLVELRSKSNSSHLISFLYNILPRNRRVSFFVNYFPPRKLCWTFLEANTRVKQKMHSPAILFLSFLLSNSHTQGLLGCPWQFAFSKRSNQYTGFYHFS